MPELATAADVSDRSVVYDLQVFAEQRHGGVSRYFRELMAHLAARGVWQPVLTPGIHVAPIPSLATQRVWPLRRVPDLPHSVRAFRAVNLAVLSARRRAVLRRATVYHPTWYHRATIERLAGLPLVITIHDLIPERWPAVTTPHQLVERRWAIEHARGILCVSQATRNALAEHYPGSEEKAVVAYLGMPPAGEATPTEGGAPPPRPGYPYFVYVGKRGSYKDFRTCLQALKRARPGVRLVVAGGGSPEPGLLAFVAEHGLGQRIEFEPAPDDGRMRQLLEGASGLVSTSREEGFGLPPLEALAAGVPVVLSDIPVYREIYGQWGSFFPVGDADALAALLDKTLESPGEPASPDDLAAMFSWERTAARTEEVYARLSA